MKYFFIAFSALAYASLISAEKIKSLNTSYSKEIDKMMAKHNIPQKCAAAYGAHPVPGSNVTGQFGRPVSHTGTDFAAWKGAPIYAYLSGKVIELAEDRYRGKYIIVAHQHCVTEYRHLLAFSVQHGATVIKGSQLGEVGQSGRATGPHLHFELRALSQEIAEIGSFNNSQTDAEESKGSQYINENELQVMTSAHLSSARGSGARQITAAIEDAKMEATRRATAFCVGDDANANTRQKAQALLSDIRILRLDCPSNYETFPCIAKFTITKPDLKAECAEIRRTHGN